MFNRKEGRKVVILEKIPGFSWDSNLGLSEYLSGTSTTDILDPGGKMLSRGGENSEKIYGIDNVCNLYRTMPHHAQPPLTIKLGNMIRVS